VRLSLPETARADVSASSVNGGINVSGIDLETVGDRTRRRLSGRLNGGGTPIELRTTNGGVRIESRRGTSAP
jgi:hypothetical protein